MGKNREALQRVLEMQKRMNSNMVPNEKGVVRCEPYNELKKIYYHQKIGHLNLKEYIEIFINDLKELLLNRKITIKDFEKFDDIIKYYISKADDLYLIDVKCVSSAVNNFICNVYNGIKQNDINKEDFNNIEEQIDSSIKDLLISLGYKPEPEIVVVANKAKINSNPSATPELAIDKLKGLDANSGIENTAPQTLATFTEVNEDGEIISPIPEVNNYNPQPMTGVTVGLEGEVKEPVDGSDEIIKKGIEKMKNKINTLPKELQALANRLAMENIEVRKGKNSNKVDGVYEIKLFKDNVKLLNGVHMYIDSKGAFSDNNEIKLYITKKPNQISSANSILLADTEKCVEYIFDHKVLNNLQNLEDIKQETNAINPNMLDINTFVDFFANTTLPCVVNGEIQAGEIDNIIITKFGACIAEAIKSTKNNCRFRIKDFINLNNFKLVSDSSVCNMDGTFVQRPAVHLELREGQLYTNLNSIQ